MALVARWPMSLDVTRTGSELVTNGNMELDSDWGGYHYPASNVRSSEQAHSGTYSRKITLDGSGGHAGIQQTISGLTIGKAYKVTSYIRGLGMASGKFWMNFEGGTDGVNISNGAWVKLEGIEIAAATSRAVIIYNDPTDIANADASFYVDDVSVKEIGTELVTNGNMEADSDWSTHDSVASQARSSDQAHTGTYSRKITMDGSGTNGGIKQSISGLTAGKYYLVTAWFYGLDVAAGNFNIAFNGSNGIAHSNGSWVENTFVRQASAASHTIYAYVTPTDASNAGKIWYVDDISVQELVVPDVSGNGHHGNANFELTYDDSPSGQSNGSIAISGASDVITLDGGTDFSTAQGTIVVWAKFSSLGNWNALFNVYEDGGSYTDYLIFDKISDNSLYLNIEDDDVQIATLNVGEVTDTDWHCCMAMQDGSGLKIYLDNVLAGSNAQTGWMDHLTSNNVQIGNNNWGSPSGYMCRTAYYDHALTLAERTIVQDLGADGLTEVALSGSLTPTGALSPIPIFVQGVGGILTLSGALGARNPAWLKIDDDLNWMGEWSEDVGYELDDVVLYQYGNEWHVFVSKAAHNTGNIPVSESTWWRRLTQEQWL